MSKSGLADSPFFAVSVQKIDEPTPPLVDVPEKSTNERKTSPSVDPAVQSNEAVSVEKSIKAKKPKEKKEKVNNVDTMIPSNHDTTVSRYRDTTTPSIHGVSVELVRKAVKEFGKEAATHRFTETEKRQIADFIYTYKNQGIKTSENEITRIAVNFVMEDYKENGENSVLHKILQALNE